MNHKPFHGVSLGSCLCHSSRKEEETTTMDPGDSEDKARQKELKCSVLLDSSALMLVFLPFVSSISS